MADILIQGGEVLDPKPLSYPVHRSKIPQKHHSSKIISCNAGAIRFGSNCHPQRTVAGTGCQGRASINRTHQCVLTTLSGDGSRADLHVRARRFLFR
jgi:hypothetical protein